MKTFDRDTFEKAERGWKSFGWQWHAIRRIAAERGFILPPRGSVHDDRDADPPSQRAIIYRALQDNPERTADIVRRSGSWGQVVDGIIGLERRLATDADELDRDNAWSRKDEPSGREATMTLKAIMDRIGDS